MDSSDDEATHVSTLTYPDNSILHLACEAADICRFFEEKGKLNDVDLKRLHFLIRRIARLDATRKYML